LDDPGLLDDPRLVLHWFDFICPFCYLAQSRNAKFVADGFEVIELPFQAHPEISPGGIAIAPRSGQMYEALEREAREVGLPLNWPLHLPDTRRALAAAEWTRRNQPRSFPQLHRALFAAHFALGEALEDPAVIERHAIASGVDLTALRAALDDGSAGAAFREAEARGHRAGVRGTPAWLLGKRLIAGLFPAANVARLEELALSGGDRQT